MRNYNIIETDGTMPIKAWTKGVPVEASALEQAKRAASLPFVRGAALMPDVHRGIGSTVGFVCVTEKAIVPACAGVDLGCGINAVQTTLTASDLPDNLQDLFLAIEVAVPHGRTDNGGTNDRGAWHNVPNGVVENFSLVESNNGSLHEQLNLLIQKHPKLERASKRAPHHLGTLGTGNHFIEVCLDLDNNVWVMLHSGSRGIGNSIGTYFIDKAKEEMARWYIHLLDQDLAYLPEGSQYFNDYMLAVEWAQTFALSNRELMMEAVLSAMKSVLNRDINVSDVAVNCHHNYIARERHLGKNLLVTRKGAVRARKGDLAVIPGSMGARSFIVEGLGNHESFHSCSHGAGRVMSRNEAKKRFTIDDHILATSGVVCKKDFDVIDETPGAYKNIDDVMAAQSDLVVVRHELKQILCVKG